MLRVQGTLAAAMVGTHLLVKVVHFPARVLWSLVLPGCLGNLPAGYVHLPLEIRKGLRSDCLQMFIDRGYSRIKFQTNPAGGTL